MKSLSMESDFLFLGWTVHDARQEKQVRYQQAVAPGPYRGADKGGAVGGRGVGDRGVRCGHLSCKPIAILSTGVA